MIRCDRLGAALLALAGLGSAFAPALARAQVARTFDASTLRGDFTVTQPPDVLLNGQAARLAPGARIRGANNLLAMSGEVVGQRLLVNYTLDIHGQILNVWVLTPAEAARKPWPVTLQQAQAWQFNADAQTWSRP